MNRSFCRVQDERSRGLSELVPRATVGCSGSLSRSNRKGAGSMKKIVLSVVAALAVTAVAPALAADMAVKAPPMAAPAPPPPVFDIAIGGVVESDYNFRGVSQSNNGPSGGAYFEPDFTTPIGTFYIGVAGLGDRLAEGPITASPIRQPKSTSTAAGAIAGARSRSISARSIITTRANSSPASPAERLLGSLRQGVLSRSSKA